MRIKQDIMFGQNLHRLRRNQRLSQAETAVEMQLHGCDISREIYAKMESGIYNIKISELLALKKIFQCEFADFFEGIPEPNRITRKSL